MAAAGALREDGTVVKALDWAELLGVVAAICLVGLMAASETALTRMNRVRAYKLADEKKRGAKALVKIVENPSPYLNVVLLLTLIGTIGGTTMASVLAVRRFENTGEWIATIFMTLVLFIFAEVTPKTYAVQNTDRVALRIAPLLYWLGRFLGPFAELLLKLANIIMPGKGLPQGPFITEHEIKALAEMASDEKEIEEEEKELIHSIFEFGDTIVREVMVPRPDIVAIEDDKALRDVQELVLQHGYSRLPVYKEDLDEVIGFAYAKDVLKALHQGKADIWLNEVVRKANFVPESKKVAELLKQMQKNKFHIAMVTDEYGSVSGLVTLEDILEELVGEITDEYDVEEPNIEPVGENRYRVNGRLAIDELEELLDVELPHEEWDTVGGLMMGLIGDIPTQGQEVDFQGLNFRVEKVQGRRIGKILITRIPAPPEEDDEQE